MNYYKRPFWYSPFFYILVIVLIGSMAFVYWSITKPLDEITTLENITNNNIKFTEDLSSTLKSKEGKVRVIKNVTEKEQEISITDSVNVGDIITTFGESKATISFGTIAQIRLNENSAIKILEAQENTLIIQQLKGNVYHRVEKDSIEFAVQTPDTQFNSQKSIFNIDLEKDSKQTNIHVLSGPIDAQIIKDGQIQNSFILKEGTFTQIAPQSQKKPNFTDFDTNEISTENIWIAWNLDTDKKYSLHSGILSDSNIPVDIILNGRYENKTVLLNWKLDEGIAKNGFRIVMSDETVTPTYPENTNHYIRNNEKREDQWRNLKAGTYHFRIGLYDGTGDILKYSNTVSIAVTTEPEENKQSILLSIKDGGITPDLSWTTENLSEVEKFFIITSESGTPIYPNDSFKEINSDSNSFRWENLDTIKDYNFRICGVINKNCKVYSNTVSWKPDSKKTEDESKKGSINLTAIQTSTSVYLEWQSKDLTTNNLGYRILLSEKSNPSLQTSITKVIESRATNAFTWNDLDENTKYYFTVCEYLGENKCGTFSNIVNVTIPSENKTNEESTIKVSGYYTWGKLHLNWTAENLNSISGYYVMVSDESGKKYPNAPYHSIAKSESYDSWTLDEAKIGDNYYISVCAQVQGSCTKYSEEIKVKIQ